MQQDNGCTVRFEHLTTNISFGNIDNTTTESSFMIKIDILSVLLSNYISIEAVTTCKDPL